LQRTTVADAVARILDRHRQAMSDDKKDDDDDHQAMSAQVRAEQHQHALCWTHGSVLLDDFVPIVPNGNDDADPAPPQHVYAYGMHAFSLGLAAYEYCRALHRIRAHYQRRWPLTQDALNAALDAFRRGYGPPTAWRGTALLRLCGRALGLGRDDATCFAAVWGTADGASGGGKK
jgi:hypothetical protein